MKVVAKKNQKETAEWMSMLLAVSPSFVCVDIETTSLSPAKGGRIIEVAGVKVRDGEMVETFSQLINPETKIYKKTIQTTGITNEMLEGKPVYGQVLPKFYEFIGDLPVVTHNASFDWDRFLVYYFKKVGIIAQNPVIDTLLLSKRYYPNQKKYGLKDLCKMNGISIEHHHRALDDAMATAKLALFYQKHFAPQDKYLETFYSIPTTINSAEISTFKIKRVKYWEKNITKKKKHQRIYVNLSVGTVYFDIPSRTWYNKDVQGNVDFPSLQQAVLKHLGLNSIEEFCNFRN